MKSLTLIIVCTIWPLLCFSQKGFTAVFLNQNPQKEVISEDEENALQQQHIENIGRMARNGELLVAGPFKGGGGLFIMNTGDKEKARLWILTDPAIRANRWNVELFEWHPRIGSACLVDETASMVERSFVRYNPYITKFNVREAPQLFLAHDNYLKKIAPGLEIIAEGIFDNNDGGFMILDTPPSEDLIMQDPTVRDGMLIPEFKTIWLAEGAFCEN